MDAVAGDGGGDGVVDSIDAPGADLEFHHGAS